MTLQPGRYGAIDIGTVTCRMLIADVLADGSVRDVERGYTIVNLGEDVNATGVLKESAMKRAEAAITHYLQRVDEQQRAYGKPIPIVAVATSAARDAQNGEEFIARVERLGVKLAIIPGEREAALSFAGVASSFACERIAVVDIGGGSTEVIVGCTGEGVQCAHSFDVGCRRVTEKFFFTDPPTEAELDAARLWIRQTMEPFFAQLAAESAPVDKVVCVAGTATSVVSIREKMVVYDTERVHGARVTRHDVDSIAKQLASEDVAKRAQTAGLDPGRAPVIVAGMLILQVVMDLFDTPDFVVSESDILQGIVLAEARKEFI